MELHLCISVASLHSTITSSNLESNYQNNQVTIKFAIKLLKSKKPTIIFPAYYKPILIELRLSEIH